MRLQAVEAGVFRAIRGDRGAVPHATAGETAAMTEEIADLPAVRTGGPGPIRNALRPPAETPGRGEWAGGGTRPNEVRRVSGPPPRHSGARP